MIRTTFLSAALALFLLPSVASAQVLGPCGTPDANTAEAAAPSDAMAIARIPLPGEQAPNFELAAVVGDKVKNIKLSDYDGKWRVVCFYPADFTFV